MDNSHIFRVSQQCRPLLLPRMLRLPLPGSSHTKKGIRHGPAGKHVQTGTRAHSLHPFLSSQEVAGNTEKREGGSEHQRAPLSLPEAFRRALESTCSTHATGPQTQCHLTSMSHGARLEWRSSRAFQALSGTQPPAGREQPVRTRPCPGACPTSPSGASWFQVQAQPFPNLWATLVFNQGELRSSTSILGIQASGSPALIMWPNSQN